MYYGNGNNAGVSPGVAALVEQIRSGRSGGGAAGLIGGAAGDRAAAFGTPHNGSLSDLGLSGPQPAVIRGGSRGHAAGVLGQQGNVSPEAFSALQAQMSGMQGGGAMPKPAIAPVRGMPGRATMAPGAPGPVHPQPDQMPPTLRARMMALQGGGGRLVR